MSTNSGLADSNNISSQSSSSWANVATDILLASLPVLVLGLAGSLLGSGGAPGIILINSGYVLSIVVGGWLLRRRGSGWREVGLARPASWLKTILLGVATIAGSLVIVNLATLLIVMLPGMAEGPDISRFNPVEGNLPLMLVGVVAAWTTIAFGEEMLFRAFIISRLAAGFGESKTGTLLAVLVSTVLFGAVHFAEGPAGLLTNGTFGLVLGLVYVWTGRNLWVTIIAHGLANTLRFVALYFGVI